MNPRTKVPQQKPAPNCSPNSEGEAGSGEVGVRRVPILLLILGIAGAFMISCPRRWHEVWWVAFGAALLLVLQVLSASEALQAALAASKPLLWLLALFGLAALVSARGLFEWAALAGARAAGGNGRRLYRNTFLLYACLTVVFSSYAAAALLAPALLGLVRRLRLPTSPYVALCVAVSCIGAWWLPISSVPRPSWLAAQGAALLAGYGVLRWHFRRELPECFHFDQLRLYPKAPPSERDLLASCSRLPWELFPFALSLFVVVRGLRNLRVPVWATNGLSVALFAWVASALVLSNALKQAVIVEPKRLLFVALLIAPLLITLGVLALAASAIRN